MKRFNKNSILFVFAAVFIVFGVWGSCLTHIRVDVRNLLVALRHFDGKGVVAAKKSIEEASDKELSYHDLMMDIDSVRNNLLGTRIIIKDDTIVVKADSGSLCEPIDQLKDSEIEAIASRINELKEFSENNGAHFLYCFAPRKELYEQLPCNVNNYAGDIRDRFLHQLRILDIPTIDFSESFGNNASGEDLFFYADHHWTVQSGFIAYASLCRELSSRYGFAYNEAYTDPENYTVSEYPDWFLGSKGKKTGTYFTRHGADDFTLITPNFRTDMTEEHNNVKREGTFEETVLFMQHLKKDYYHDITYITYSGGDHSLQIIENRLNRTGVKILIIKDSFACVVTPFLALQTAELHICDLRYNDYWAGGNTSLKEYILEAKPDYVIVLYSGVNSLSEAKGKYDFLPAEQ